MHPQRTSYTGGFGYRNIVSGSTSVGYWGVVTITAATAVTIHLTFGLKMKTNRTLETTASVTQMSSESLHGKSHVGREALTTRLALLYNRGWPTLLIGLAEKKKKKG